MTAAALAKSLGKTAPAQDANTCKSVNAQAIDNALKLVSAKTKERYLSTLKQLTTEDDETCSTGVGWESTSFTFDASSGKVDSPRLTTGLDAPLWPGEQLCKYLSPERVIEYMMVDGLPAFDACPQKVNRNVIV